MVESKSLSVASAKSRDDPMPARVIEFYCGLHEALRLASPDDARVVAAYDWDPNAVAVYEANYGKGIARRQDISKLTAEDLETFDASIWLASPACQPYSVLGLQKGAADPRAQSFLHLMHNVLATMVEHGTQPKYLLVENVAGFESSSTRTDIVALLKQLEYSTVEFLLTPSQFGIPNSRLRYYLIGRRAPFRSGYSETVLQYIPGDGMMPNIPVKSLEEFLDREVDGQFAIPDRVLERWGRLFDIVTPSSKNTCCFTRGYTHLIEGSGSILQTNKDLITNDVFEEFLRQQKQGISNAVQTLHKLGLRYFTPEELLRLFYISNPCRVLSWPDSTTVKTRYRLIGNSVNVLVVAHVITFLLSSAQINDS